MIDTARRPRRRPADVALDLLLAGRPRDYVARYLLTATIVEARLEAREPDLYLGILGR